MTEANEKMYKHYSVLIRYIADQTGKLELEIEYQRCTARKRLKNGDLPVMSLESTAAYERF